MRFIGGYIRYYCKRAAEKSAINIDKLSKNHNSKIDFKNLKYPSKVPAQPHADKYTAQPQKQEVLIDNKVIQLLERLALVDLDSRAALKALQSSIEFAQFIEKIPTENVEPLYTVLEQENLQLRQDIVTEGDCREHVLSNAKKTEEDYFVAPVGNIPLEQEEEKHFDGQKL